MNVSSLIPQLAPTFKCTSIQLLVHFFDFDLILSLQILWDWLNIYILLASFGSVSDVGDILSEVQIEILRNSLLKLYLQDFYDFCEGVGGESQVCEIWLKRHILSTICVLGDNVWYFEKEVRFPCYQHHIEFFQHLPQWCLSQRYRQTKVF